MSMNADELLSFVSALAIGLLIGFERERSHPPGTAKVGGSRTFALVAVSGALAASLDMWVVVSGLLAVSAFIVIGYRRTSVKDPGTTTEVALFATFLLGALAIDHAALAAGVAILITVILFSKKRIHSFARVVVTDLEFEDALKFAVIAFVVLPLLPDEDLGPYGAINPHKIWLLVVAFTAISWVGYIAVRVLGDRRGLLLTGLAGGFVSASATTAAMGRLARIDTTEGRPIGTAVAGALLASVATFVQLVAIMIVANPEVAWGIWPACLISGSVLAILSLLDQRRHRNDGSDPAAGPSASPVIEDSDERASRPFALRSALLLAAVLTSALLAGRWASEMLGTGGVYLAAAGAGLADAHAGALAAAELNDVGAVMLGSTLVAIALALAANTITKTVLAFVVGGRRFGVRLALGLWPTLLAFAISLGVTMLFTGA